MRSTVVVLYVVPEPFAAQARAEMEVAGGAPKRGNLGNEWMVVAQGDRTYQFRLATSIAEALALLSEHYFNFVVVENRETVPSSATASDCVAGSMAQAFMERVHQSGNPERMYPLDRIVAVLDRGSCLADQAFAMGRWRIGGYVVDPFDGSLFEQLDALSANATPGKSAVCLAGGGVEGFLFEVGVMQALNAHLQNRSVTDFEIFCGISSGSMLAAFLANQTEPEDIATAMTKRAKRTRDPQDLDEITPRIIFDPHVREYVRRLWQLLRHAPPVTPEQLFTTVLKTIPTGFFCGATLERFLAKQLTRGGRSNDFRELKRELYIGATEQDTSAHTVFGSGQWRDIPISVAVQASSALTPFFEPKMIRGRYFVDGQYTRTSNFNFAVERGAKLVIVVNPLVPVRVEQPGYVLSKGGVFAGLQALKAVIHSRFMLSIRNAAETNPDVDFILFVPEAQDMRLMSGSPMKYRIRTEIMNMAYRCTVRKIQRDFEILSQTFAKHGFRLQRQPRLRADHREVG